MRLADPRMLDGNARMPRLATRIRPQDRPLVATAPGLPDESPIFETRALVVQAAVAGPGAGMVDRNRVAGLLAEGLLAARTRPPMPLPQGHWFVATPVRA